MNVYLLVCICFSIAAICETFFPKIVRNIFFVCNGIFLFVVVGGRACGTDYWLYKRVVDSGLMWNVGWPVPFSWLSAHIPWQVIIFLEAALTIFPIYFVFWKFTARYRNLMALFFVTDFFFMTLMQQSRQGVSIALAMLALLYMQNIKKAAAVNLSAISFHSTSVIGLIPLFLPQKYLKPWVYFLMYGVAVLLGGFLLSKVFPHMGIFGNDYVLNKMVSYADRSSRVETSLPLVNTKFVLFGILIFFCYRFVKDERVAKLVNVLFFGICFYTFFISIPDLAVRGNRFFSYAYFFMLIFIIDKSNLNKNKKLIFWFISIAYAVYYLQASYSKIFVQNDILSLVPYAFF